MGLNLFDLLKKITAGKSINTDALIPYIKADPYLIYHDKEDGGVVEYLFPNEEGDQYKSLEYKEHFKDQFDVLINAEKEFWLTPDKDLSDPKYLRLVNTKFNVVNANIEFIQKGINDISDSDDRLKIANNLTDKLKELSRYYRVIMKALKAGGSRVKQERIRINLSVRELSFMLKILLEQDIVQVSDGELEKTFRVLTNSFITNGLF